MSIELVLIYNGCKENIIITRNNKTTPDHFYLLKIQQSTSDYERKSSTLSNYSHISDGIKPPNKDFFYIPIIYLE